MDSFSGKIFIGGKTSFFRRENLKYSFQIKACMEAADCQPDFCLDLFEPSGHGRRRRAIPNANDINATAIEYTKFKENIEYTVIMPGEYESMRGMQDPDQCKNFVLISGLLAMLLALSTIIVSFQNQTESREHK